MIKIKEITIELPESTKKVLVLIVVIVTIILALKLDVEQAKNLLELMLNKWMSE